MKFAELSLSSGAVRSARGAEKPRRDAAAAEVRRGPDLGAAGLQYSLIDPI